MSPNPYAMNKHFNNQIFTRICFACDYPKMISNGKKEGFLNWRALLSKHEALPTTYCQAYLGDFHIYWHEGIEYGPAIFYECIHKSPWRSIMEWFRSAKTNLFILVQRAPHAKTYILSILKMPARHTLFHNLAGFSATPLIHCLCTTWN